jgi:hypothetical protein
MGRISFRLHALQQMVERGISRADVLRVFETGTVIEAAHHAGRPLPTRLVLGWASERPLDVLIADDPEGDPLCDHRV